MKRLAAGLFLSLILAGCGDVQREFKEVEVAAENDPRFFPAPKERLEDGSLLYVDGFQKGPTCRQEGDIKHGSGGGYIVRPIGDAWSRARTAPGVKWKEAEQLHFSAVPQKIKSGEFAAFFTQDNNHITWEIEWHHRVVEGTWQNPELVKISFTMLHAGKWAKVITAIDEWYGAILLRHIAPGVTGFYMDNYISGRASCADSQGAVSDIFNNLHL